MVRSLLGKSPKKEQIEVMSPKKEEKVTPSKKEERQVLEPLEGNSFKLEDEQFLVTKPTSNQEDITVKIVEPVLKECSEICEPQSANIEVNTEGDTTQKHVTAQTGGTSNGLSLEAASSTTCNGGSPPSVSGAIPRIEVFEASLPSEVEVVAPVIHSSPSNGLPKHITSSSNSSPVAPSPSRIPSRQPTSSSSTQHQQSSANSSQGHSPVGLQGFDLKTGLGGQVGGQEDLRKLESRIERFVSRSSGSECRCEMRRDPGKMAKHLTHFDSWFLTEKKVFYYVVCSAREAARHQGREQRAV